MTERNTHIIHIMASLIFILAISFVSTSSKAQTKRALVVGISEYPQSDHDSWGSIHGANDVALITPILKKQGFFSSCFLKGTLSKRTQK